MAECEKVCRYIDLPLQHASAAVLKRMRRPGNRRVYDQPARADPRAAFRASRSARRLIVGFPGETEADFAELEGFVADTGFDHVGVFTYSHEEGTRAYALADDVPAAVKRRRRNALMARQKQIVAARAEAAHRVGRCDVLVDGPSSRARTGPAGPARGAGARHRLDGLPDRLRPVGVSRAASSSAPRSSARADYDLVARPLDGRRLAALPGAPLDQAAVAVCYIHGWQLRVRLPEWACAHFLCFRGVLRTTELTRVASGDVSRVGWTTCSARVAGRSTGSTSSTSSLRRECRSGRCCGWSIDRPGPAACRRTGDESVGIEDCQRVSHDLSALLDVEEDELGEAALAGAYTLEVSSPGLDRPLRHEADYRRFAGRLAKVVTAAPIDGQSAFAGRLAGVEQGAVLLEEGRKRASRAARQHQARAAGGGILKNGWCAAAGDDDPAGRGT